jgi:hypothetical protein
MRQQSMIRRGLGVAAGALTLASIAVVGTASLAGAVDSQGSGSRPAPPALSTEQRQCLTDQGVTLPQKPADGSRPQLTQEQRDAFRAAAQACGIPLPAHHAPANV